MLINLSNHPTEKWQEKQKKLAKETYGILYDIAFPAVPATATHNEIQDIAKILFNKIIKILDECANEPLDNAVHIQGEFTLVFTLVTMLKQSAIRCIASTSERNVQDNGGKKIVIFNFVNFREY